MITTHSPLIVANWKMNPATPKDAKELFVAIRATAKKFNDREVVIAPPFPFLTELGKLAPSGSVGLGAQSVFYEEKGAFTGEVSATMLAATGVQYVIVGHSERRALGEDDVVVAKKLSAVLKAKLLPILCVGEQTRDASGAFFDVVKEQLTAALTDVPKSRLQHVTIAYEPVWAIGTGKNATAADVEEMQLYIRKVLTNLYDRTAAGKVRVLYGGSVNAKNVEMLYREGAVNGFLVGGASLRPADFSMIIKTTEPKV